MSANGGGGGFAGSQPMSTAVDMVPPINIEDLTPYLTYDVNCAAYREHGTPLSHINRYYSFNTPPPSILRQLLLATPL
jgi:hypothetical protein